MTKSEKMKEIINNLWKEPAILNVGKNGVNENFINEFKTQLKRNRVIKLKILKSAINNNDKDQIISEIVFKGNAKCLEIRGNQVIFSRKTAEIE